MISRHDEMVIMLIYFSYNNYDVVVNQKVLACTFRIKPALLLLDFT